MIGKRYIVLQVKYQKYGASYSTMDGEINTMFAPVQNMSGDTITISAQASFADGYKSNVKTLKFVIE
jgi:hypothetical protein